MNFDADRLSRLSGLGPIKNTGAITESKKIVAESTHPSPRVPPISAEQPSGEIGEAVLFEMEDDLGEDMHKEAEVEETAKLTMDTLRETVLELRNEILAEQAEERQALAEAPARTAIRREIKALLAEMPADAATNWIYGKKGKPSAHNKSRAIALLGAGFENSKH
jgi:hypothetical protein